MLNFFKKTPKAKLQKSYTLKLEEAMQAQRKGDIRLYSELTAQAEQILKEIDELGT